jgi:hypothetical protein
MSCCGKGSSPARRPNSFHSTASTHGPNTVPLKAYLRCTGPSTITAIGAASGKAYRFPSSGLVVPIDIRDAVSLSRVPHLQAVRPR